MKTSDACKWIHQELEQLGLVSWPFQASSLPLNGIYFFYERGEVWGHGGDHPRIVRAGSHRDGNFRSRISEHFLPNAQKMNFNAQSPAPKDRSIFRKNIGRALLNRMKSPYLEIWEKDFTTRGVQEQFLKVRDISLEKQIESEITQHLRENCSFRYIILENQINRFGGQGLESRIIGTLAQCELCQPSSKWLGNYSPVEKVRESGLWLSQHLRADPLDESAMELFSQGIKKANEWMNTSGNRLCDDIIEI